MAFKLITDNDVKAFGKGNYDTAFDSLLNDFIIPAVGDLFANYTGRPDFDQSARTEYFSPRPGTCVLFLACPPVAASPAVQLWEDSSIPRAYGAGTAKTNGTDFIVHEDQGVIERLGWFTPGAKAVKVTYTGGFLTANNTGCPSDLRLAAIAQAKIFFDRREELGLTSRSLEGGSMAILPLTTLPRHITMILDKYRIYSNAA